MIQKYFDETKGAFKKKKKIASIKVTTELIYRTHIYFSTVTEHT